MPGEMLYTPHNTITPTSIMVGSQGYVDLLNPSSDALQLEDVAAGLDTPRFRNQTAEPLTIGEHMLRAARVGVALDQPLPMLFALMCHDAGECLLPDVPGPIKPYLFFHLEDETVQFAVVENRLRRKIIEKFAPPDMVEDILKAVDSEICHDIDRITLQLEAMLWLHGAEDWCSREPTLRGSVVHWSRILPAAVAPRSSMAWADIVAWTHTDPASLRALLRGHEPE